MDKESSTRTLLAASFVAVIGLANAFAVVASCSSADDGRGPRSITMGADGGTSSGVMGSHSEEEDPGAPCVEGTKRECHVTVGTNNGVITCLSGERTCIDGTWGPCVGEFSARVEGDSLMAADSDPTEVRLFNLTDAGPCEANPCDPYCQDFEHTPPVDGGFQVIPTVQTVYFNGSLEEALALNPPGFVSKGMSTPCSDTADCQFDSHCVESGTQGVTCPNDAARCCMAWTASAYDTNCPKPDVTTGFGCTKNGVPHIPVCNRGSATLPAGSKVYVFPGNAPQFPLCDPNDQPKSECLVDVAIAPGHCIDVTNCMPPLGGNGTRTIFANPPLMATPGGKSNPLHKDECTCTNNWGVWSGDTAICYEKPNYFAPPVVKTQIYEAVCPTGTRVQWGYLTWDTTTPLDSSVLWKGRVAMTDKELSVAAFVSLGTAKVNPAPDTHLCAAGGPAECPINLFTALGGSPAARSTLFELEITINPSNDQTQGARVNGWQITYSCPPSE